jgi:hypothetical protein
LNKINTSSNENDKIKLKDNKEISDSESTKNDKEEENAQNHSIKNYCLDENIFKHIRLVSEWNKSKPLSDVSPTEYKVLLRNSKLNVEV